MFGVRKRNESSAEGRGKTMGQYLSRFECKVWCVYAKGPQYYRVRSTLEFAAVLRYLEAVLYSQKRLYLVPCATCRPRLPLPNVVVSRPPPQKRRLFWS